MGPRQARDQSGWRAKGGERGAEDGAEAREEIGAEIRQEIRQEIGQKVRQKIRKNGQKEKMTDKILIDGDSLTVDEAYAVAAEGLRVELDPRARARMLRTRAVV